ncbi:DUF2188 domain-containing protein [Ferruginibacter sp. HRS2-29]|uniref:DUF2188 domain-containing protein n=1 Tax=Ferruginibacter sp. HRS2-29 TaxID=2487334 RepID=UPI0020CF0D0A|nr:DUF2188 domain-containing protein [Ferruginibacter sp. HRS2-29]MCP9749520.1 DUF2188 domain-containing protein [Ferruginibacter sp. HRS2-29]MCP9751558.1 DUF2188 domain-containing protein [Ferruginibacter sp. HRS2-29]MCP9751569.1 DUF2188 domain-containing protein [Ferruginibacter sp. HRS2-29]
MSSSIEHVLPLGNGWIVKNDKSAKFTTITDTKKEAIEIARNIARKKNIILLVYAKDGTIQLEESYVE